MDPTAYSYFKYLQSHKYSHIVKKRPQRNNAPNVWEKFSEKAQHKLQKDGRQYSKVLKVLVPVPQGFKYWPCQLLWTLGKLFSPLYFPPIGWRSSEYLILRVALCIMHKHSENDKCSINAKPLH